MGKYNPRQERSLKRRTGYRVPKQSFLIILKSATNMGKCYFYRKNPK